MINSLKLSALETSYLSKGFNEHPKSQPASPRKYHLKKTISVMSNRHPPANIWKESSMSLTRDRSPSHKIPNSMRFGGRDEEDLKNRQFVTLELRRDIKSERGVCFPKSHRPEHFVKGLGESGPSPASYKYSRFMDDANYSTMSVYNYNPELSSTDSNKMKWAIKGRSFSNFNNHHKSYLPHSKHRFYQPEQVVQQPGPGHYEHSWVNKEQKQSYSMRIAMKRFNQTPEMTPGPGAYGTVHSERVSPNVKGTMAKSRRTFLTKFEANPSPGHYQIARFLEK